MNRTAKWFWTIVAAQAAFLFAWAGYHEFVRQHAPVILLKGRPVDPQDLLRGDYMTMGYEINFPSIAESATNQGTGNSVGNDAWVLLEQRGKYHEVVQTGHEWLQPGPGQVLVRGSFGYDFRRVGEVRRINYGIERYFVPEGKGSPRFTLVEIEVSVSPAHRLYIKRVLLDGKSYP